jgi:hypothetical protein
MSYTPEMHQTQIELQRSTLAVYTQRAFIDRERPIGVDRMNADELLLELERKQRAIVRRYQELLQKVG